VAREKTPGCYDKANETRVMETGGVRVHLISIAGLCRPAAAVAVAVKVDAEEDTSG
jgi:hypothetical protein